MSPQCSKATTDKTFNVIHGMAVRAKINIECSLRSSSSMRYRNLQWPIYPSISLRDTDTPGDYVQYSHPPLCLMRQV